MKKIIALLLALAMCVSLCACGKSEALTNVEGLIDAIGEVTSESESAITAAEEAYNALTEEEKAEVENYAVLTAAKERLNECVMDGIFLGEWVDLLGGVLVLNGDKSFSLTNQNETLKGFFEYVENGINLDFEIIEYTLELQELNGVQYLISQEAGMAFVRQEYTSTSEFEINIDNWQDYFTIEKQTVIYRNGFGELDNLKNYYCFILKDDFVNRLVGVDSDSKYKITVEATYNTGNKYFELDGDEIVITGNAWYDDVKSKEIRDISQSEIGRYFGVQSRLGPAVEQGVKGPYIASEFGFYDDWEARYLLISCDNFEISRIQGTLLLYDLPLQNEIIRNMGMNSGVAGAPAEAPAIAPAMEAPAA